MQIGDRLRTERERLGLTQTEAAALCGVAFRTYCDYEAGKTEPKASALSNLNKYGLNVMYILTGQLITNSDISVEEQKLLENYRAMNEAARLNMQAVSSAFAQSELVEKTKAK